MKYLTSLAMALICGVASASGVSWQLAGKSFTTSDGSNERAKGYYVQIFMYDDYDDVMSIVTSWNAPVADASALDSYMKDSGTTSASGAKSGGFDLDDATYPSVTTVSLFMIAWDGASVGAASNYLVSNEVLSDAYSGTDTPTNTGAFSNASFSGKSWTQIAAVPEPSVAVMGLLGLGLLLKRRKA